jgi:hypothetical protein
MRVAAKVVNLLNFSFILWLFNGCTPDVPRRVEGKRLTEIEKALLPFQVGDSLKYKDQEGNTYLAICYLREEKVIETCLSCNSVVREAENTYARVDVVKTYFTTTFDKLKVDGKTVDLMEIRASPDKADATDFSKLFIIHGQNHGGRGGSHAGLFTGNIAPDDTRRIIGFDYIGDKTINGRVYQDVHVKMRSNSVPPPYNFVEAVYFN